MNRKHYLLQEVGTQLRDVAPGAPCSGQILIVAAAGAEYAGALAAMLPQCTFVVEPAPEVARHHFLSSPIDLVILDHSPHAPCLDLLPTFKAHRPSVSVIVVTSCSTDELVIRAFRHGAIDFFRKPLDLGELELAIRAILEFQKARREQTLPPLVNGLQRAYQHIEEHLPTPLKLETVAREAGMSVSCFERYLKNQTGMTFVDYVSSLRVARAKEMLRTPNVSMLQVALACGFNNQSHFNRVFKRIAKITPGAYRKAGTPRETPS